ncbi:MAG: M6 family metalloprotease domain-containing protein, partial [Epsilonproteobacteria bacterium]|nr:M6 family metalloprotease domain-containing protein [Campylobacterota bacterium]
LNSYYNEASAGNFSFAIASESQGTPNDGVVRVTLNENHPNTSIDSFSAFAAALYPDFKSALAAVDSSVNFAAFDTNHDTLITPDELILTFIIAGYEDAYEGYHVTNGVWAHQSCMESAANVATLDGVSMMGCSSGGNFALFGEKHDIRSRATHDATIGIIAHELGHAAFDLPDLYNTAGDFGGIGYFGIMGAGTWTQKSSSEYAGATPTHFSAWSKSYMGWVTPTEEKGVVTLNASSLTSYNIIKIPISSSEYYLLENRNNSGYDRGLAQLGGTFEGGIALWHVNNDKLTSTYFNANTVNADTANKGVDIVEASNPVIDTQATGGDAANLFYSGNVSSYGTIFHSVSAPGSFMTLNIN